MRAGDAVERWRARLAVAGDVAQEEGQDGGNEEGMAEDAGVDRQEEAPDAGAEFQFLPEAAEARSGMGTKKPL